MRRHEEKQNHTKTGSWVVRLSKPHGKTESDSLSFGEAGWPHPVGEVPIHAGKGRGAGGPGSRGQTSPRCGDDVQDSGIATLLQFIGGADGISDQRPPFVPEVFGVDPGRFRSGQEHDLGFQGVVECGGGVEELFRCFEGHLKEAGLVGSEGKIIDASFVDVPRQRNSREENEVIKAGAVPVEFGTSPHRLGQKDMAARWTKQGGEVHYGYKNHVKADRKTKLIEDYAVTAASVHDSQVVGDLIEEGDGQVHADSAYCGAEIEEALAEKGIRSEIHERAYRNHPLTEEQKISNRRKSKIRVRVEHIFGQMTNAMRDGLKMRSIGIKRITGAVGFLNLVYNMARYEQILRLGLS